MPRKKSRVVTAEDMLKKLQNDEDYQEAKRKRESVGKALTKRLREAEEPFRQEIAKLGIEIEGVWDLVALPPKQYKNAIPILHKYLTLEFDDHEDQIREGIVRALTCVEARGKVEATLFNMFEKCTNDRFRWAIGNALATVATEKDWSILVRLYGDKRYGPSRSELAGALVRIRAESAVDLIEAQMNDEGMLHSALEALGKTKSASALPILKNYENYSDALLRSTARRGIKKISSRIPLDKT